MTTDIKLLPLPDELRYRYGYMGQAEHDATVGNYARANVAHVTAAKDAEIEALRAEVAAVWNAMPSGTRYLDPPDGGDVPLHEQVRRMAADAVRAERLAETLRLARDLVEDWAGYASEYFQKKHNLEGDLALLDAALRDHDQEEK